MCWWPGSTPVSDGCTRIPAEGCGAAVRVVWRTQWEVGGPCSIPTNFWFPLGLLCGQGRPSLLWVPSCWPLASVSCGGHGHWGLRGGREGGAVTLGAHPTPACPPDGRGDCDNSVTGWAVPAVCCFLFNVLVAQSTFGSGGWVGVGLVQLL